MASLGLMQLQADLLSQVARITGPGREPQASASILDKFAESATLEPITEVCTGFDDRAVEGLIASRSRYGKLGGLDQPENLLRRPSADEFDPRFWSDVPQAYLGAIAD
jgi:hypothetical protein